MQLLSDEARDVLKGLSPVFAPQNDGSLGRAETLVYNDAPWLNITRADLINRYVHSKISNDVAIRIGARSLRQLLLRGKEETQNIACPQPRALRHYLEEVQGGTSTHIIKWFIRYYIGKNIEVHFPR